MRERRMEGREVAYMREGKAERWKLEGRPREQKTHGWYCTDKLGGHESGERKLKDVVQLRKDTSKMNSTLDALAFSRK